MLWRQLHESAYLGVVVQNLCTVLAPNATQLVPAKWYSSVKLVPGVHPDGSCLQPPACHTSHVGGYQAMCVVTVAVRLV